MAIGESVREKILAAMVSALNAGADKPCTAYRTRVDALAANELPAYIVRALDEAVVRPGPDTAKRDLTVRIECHSAGEAPQDQALDPLLVYAVQTLYADEPLSALIAAIGEDRVQWVIEGGYDEQAIAALDIRVQYLTRATDPTAARN